MQACMPWGAFTTLTLPPAQPPSPCLLRQMLCSIYACPFLLIYIHTEQLITLQTSFTCRHLHACTIVQFSHILLYSAVHQGQAACASHNFSCQSIHYPTMLLILL